MAVDHVEIKDFLVFRGGFSCDFGPGVNVIIGGNATGKTTLLKVMYALCESTKGFSIFSEYFSSKKDKAYSKHFDLAIKVGDSFVRRSYTESSAQFTKSPKFVGEPLESVFIPEKDMLSNAKGLPETVEYGKAQYTQVEVDIIKRARVLANCPEQPLYRKICDIIGGEPETDGQSFFMKRTDIDGLVPFSLEASGYRKFGLLAALIRNEQVKSDAVLFWDEPENSLNPELVPVLVDILLELSRSGVQIFLATHSEMLSSYFDTLRKSGDKVMFYSLYKDGEQIKADSNDRFDLLNPNKLTEEPVKLYEKKLDKVLGDE
jgi:AAA15 family ATPase/GTPase